MDPSTCRANSIIEKIKNATLAVNLIKNDVEDFLQKTGSSSSRSEFASKCLNKLSLSVSTRLENGTLTRGDSLRQFVATVVACHDHIFNRGYDFSDSEDSQIERCLYAILYKIIDKDYREAIVVSELIVKGSSRSHRIPSAAHVGPIVRNSFILLWNASLKLEQLPAEALRVRLVALSHLSLSDDPKCTVKFCDRALNSALLFSSALDKRGRESSDLDHFTASVLDMFCERCIVLLDYGEERDTQDALEKLVRLIHVNVNRNLKCGRFDETTAFLAKMRMLPDACSRLQKFGDRNGSIQFSFDVLKIVLLLSKAVWTNSANQLTDKIFSRLTARVTGFTTANFSQFDENCYFLAVSALRNFLYSVFEKTSNNTSIVQVLVPFFRGIVTFFTCAAEFATSLSTTVGDVVVLLDHLALYQSHHLKIVIDTADEQAFKNDLSFTTSTLEVYHRSVIAATKNRIERIDTFVQRIFYVATVPYAKKMYAEVVVVVHRYAEAFVESFGDAETSISKRETFWKRMTVLVQCLSRTLNFKDALQLLALFISKGHVMLDDKVVSLWVSVMKEARYEKDVSVKTLTIPKLVTQFCTSMTTIFPRVLKECRRSRMASLLSEEVQLLKDLPYLTDDVYSVLCDLLTYSDDTIQTSSTLILMARALLGRDQQCDSEGRTASDCCKRALHLLNGPSTRTTRWFVVQAKFVAYLSRLRQVYDTLDGKVSRQRARQIQFLQNQHKEAERVNAAAAAAAADDSDGDAARDTNDFASYQPCNVSEELECMVELDECIDAWMVMLNDEGNHAEVNRSLLAVLSDLKLAAEIYSNARIFKREVVARQLYVKLANEHGKWTEYIQGSSQLVNALARLGLVEMAEQVLQEAVSNADRLECKAGNHIDITQASISLQLAHSELRLMQGRVADGFDHLCSAADLIQAEKKYRTVMLLEGRSLLLRSKYTELRSPSSSSPLECASDALRLFLGILKACSEGNNVEPFNVELIGCLLDCGLQLSRLFYDVGLLRDARCYLKEQMTWSQRFFCVSRTAEVLLLFARVDLSIGETCGCQTKLNAVRRVIDSKDRSCLQPLDRACPPSPLPMSHQLSLSPETDNFLSTPMGAERLLAKLEPASMLKSSPTFLPSSSSSSTVTDLASFDGHPIKCMCSWCSNVALLRIRVEFILVNYELAGTTRNEAVFQQIKLLAHNEKTLLKNISAVSSVPSSHADVCTCWTLSRVADGLLDTKDGVRALRVVKSATALLSKVQVGLSLLNFLQATLTYQECLAMLLVKAAKAGKRSVSELCESAWSRNRRIVDSSDVNRLAAGFGRLGLNCEFKTPTHNVLRANRALKARATCTTTSTNAMIECSASSMKKTVDCRAPTRTATRSLFQHNFEDDDVIKIALDGKDLLDEVSDKPCTSKDGATTMTTTTTTTTTTMDKQQTTTKRRVVAVIAISDKENSDVDDLSPIVTSKKKNKKPTTARRKLRSNSKITISDGDGDVKTKKARKSPKAKFQFGSPLEGRSSRVNVEQSRINVEEGPRTRSKSTADDAPEVERFRAKNPTSDQAIRVIKWRSTESKVPIVIDDSDDDDEAERRFNMDDVVRRLDDALRSVERFPRVPLYGDLNLLLALCKGDMGTDTAKTKPRNGVEHVLESVSVSFRHNADLSLKSHISNSSSMNRKDVERRRILSHREGSLLSCKDGGDEGMQQFTNRFPKDWVVCQVNALPTAFSGVSSNTELVLTRLENGRCPIMVKIRNPRKNMAVRDFFSEFEAILTENSAKMRVGTSTQWWEMRRALDARLQVFLSSLEDTLLGAWKCLLRGRRATSEDRKQLRDAMLEMTEQLSGTFDKGSVDKHLLELVLDSWPLLKERRDCWRTAVAHACRLTDVADPRIDIVHSVLNIQSVKMWSTENDVRRHVVVLILDKVFHCLPWENLPVLRQHAVTRVPSVHVFLGHVALHLDDNNNNQPVPKCPLVDTSNSYYVLNPSKDLSRTENTFTPIFQNLKWTGVTGQSPTVEEWLGALKKKDLFVYSGHGSGSHYANGDKIDRGTCRAVAILMGCSSARLRTHGIRFEPYGIVYNYLLAGCPYVMGNLWDVTDKDIDRFLAVLLQWWIPGSEQKDDSLAHVLPTARLKTILGFIIGAAPVAYGIPVYS